MSKDEHDTDGPILILVRRGRRGKGFLVCAADDMDNPAPCSDETDLGEVISEMLNDPSQARVDMGSDAAPEPSKNSSMARQPAAEDEDEEEAAEEEDDSFLNGLDPLERLAFLGGKKLLDKGRELSNSYRTPGKVSRRRKSRSHH